MVDDNKILQLTAVLRDAARPKKIILFGSQARSAADAGSDIDILIVEANVKDLLVVSEEAYEYWSSTPGNVYYQASTQGMTLYEAA
jgi:predicted nucleotidyltransferase